MHSACPGQMLRVWIMLAICASSLVTAKITQKQLELSWEFSWDSQLALPNPITAQCETLHIQSARSGTTGPDPVAPYTIQLFSSNEIAPLVIDAGSGLEFDLQIPFGPSTQYQLCMYDSNGATGGCQAVYTVYPTVDSVTGEAPTCNNVTFPEPLAVDLTRADGSPLSKYGFIDECAELLVTPRAGQPPFVMTVASALRPPLNITSTTMDPIPWTVALDWATPFFLSLEDSTGKTWTNGPLHAGGPGQTTDCLTPRSKKTDADVIAGSVFGGIALGIMMSMLSKWLIAWTSARKQTVLPVAFPSTGRFDPEKRPPSTVVDLNLPLPAMEAVPPTLPATSYGSRQANQTSNVRDGPPGPPVMFESTNPRTARKLSRDISRVLTNRSVEANSRAGSGEAAPSAIADRQPRSLVSTDGYPRTVAEADVDWSLPSAGSRYLMHSDGGVVELPPSYPSESHSEAEAEARRAD